MNCSSSMRPARPGKGMLFPAGDAYFREFEASFVFEETREPDGCHRRCAQGHAVPNNPWTGWYAGMWATARQRWPCEARLKRCTTESRLGGPGAHHRSGRTALSDLLPSAWPIIRWKSPCCPGSRNRPNRRKCSRTWPKAGWISWWGTHRLLSKDVAFKDLGLLVIDEEHRFGVAAKEKLKKIRTEVDVLTLTATPIPRTLNMSLTGIRDLSVDRNAA